MLYASLKAVHLLAIIVWVGGMFFMLACLRPAAAEVLDPPARMRLMHAAMRRFFDAVTIAAVVAFLSGAAMIGVAWREAARTGIGFNMPLDWYTMTALFFVMLAIFAHVRLVLLGRVAQALAAQDWPAAAAAIGTIRWEVTVNLVLGVFIVVIMRLGGTA
ncbi:MAG TPA: CopD family protein [Caldimonas sp.]|nr:CopD family protein [Caldimonas sp.]